MNSAGGTLLIGVKDDGQIFGLEADGFPGEDRFLLHLNKLLGEFLGTHHAAHLDTSIVPVGEREVCVVQVLPSYEPVFFSRDNHEYFFVRAGPATEALKPSQLLAYAKNRTESGAF